MYEITDDMNTDFVFNDIYEVYVDFLTVCNYHCEYCYARANKDTWGKILLKKDIDRFLNVLKKSGKRFYLSLLGGEPLMHPLLNYILDECNKHDCFERVFITTNFSKPINNIHLNNKTTVSITIHPSQIKNYKQLLNGIRYLKTKNITVNVSVMLLKRYEQQLLSVCDKIKEIGVERLEYEFITSNSDRIQVTNALIKDSQDKRLYSYDGKLYNSYDFIKKKLHYLNGWSCYPNYFYVDIHGNIIHACKGVVGNINKGNFFKDLKFSKIICDREYCPYICWLNFPKEMNGKKLYVYKTV